MVSIFNCADLNADHIFSSSLIILLFLNERMLHYYLTGVEKKIQKKDSNKILT